MKNNTIKKLIQWKCPRVWPNFISWRYVILSFQFHPHRVSSRASLERSLHAQEQLLRSMKSWIYMTGVIVHVQWRGNHNDHGILYFSEEPTSHYGMTDLYYNVGWSLQEVDSMLFYSWPLRKNIFDAIRIHPRFLSMSVSFSVCVSPTSLFLSHTVLAPLSLL